MTKTIEKDSKAMNYTLWAIQGLLALLFLFAGGMKLVLPIAEMTKDMPMPGWFLRFIGVAEVLGGLGLILPGLLRTRQALTPLAAGGLVIIMIGATALTLPTGAIALIPLAVGLLAAFVAYGRRFAIVATASDTFRVQRVKNIQAPPERIYALIEDFHQWGSWSPYEKLDPTMKRSYSGAPSGPGAVYAWAGKSKVGEGRMEIVETLPGASIRIKLDFLKPFEGHNMAEFTLEPQGDSTKVTWATYGPQSSICKLMTIFVSMDNLMGKAFETGLANLKAVAEGRSVYEVV